MRLALALVACLLAWPAAAEAHGGWGFSWHYAPPPPPPCYHYCPPPYPGPIVHFRHHGGYYGHHHGRGHHHGHGHHRPRVGVFFGF